MPDISMCRNTACSLREDCYRFTATPNPLRQAYSAFQFYVVDGATKCDYFWDDKEYKETK